MKIGTALHPWAVSPAEAREIQKRLSARVIDEDHLGKVNTVAGIDVGFEDQGSVTRAAVVVLSYPELQLLDRVIACAPTQFPYVPGLLSFREVPAVLKAFEDLKTVPDLVLCDGQGIAHPRRFGIACHIGLLTDLPTIGVAKSRLVGTHAEPPQERGSHVPLRNKDEQVGVVLRTRKGVKPLFISVGHRISLTTATQYVMGCAPRYRLPETTRWADRIASRRESMP
ncbi:MAG: deoxyribonuclease V [Gammaproteobacteria bacterium]|nr:deoxyribonuclease V [Gammaproteobacteria bacterium]